MSNKKIALSIIVIFTITFGVLIAVAQIKEFKNPAEKYDLFIEEKSQEFFAGDFSDSKTIFVLGSSHVARLNGTLISEIILKETSNNFKIYNLAKDGTSPYLEIKYLDEIISANPEIIVFGISYRDFGFPYNEKLDSELLPEIGLVINQFFFEISKDLIPPNPQATTRTIMRYAMNDFETMPIPERCDEKIFVSDVPFEYYCKDSKIIDSKKLPSRAIQVEWWNDPIHSQKNINALYTIIERLNKNNIHVIILVTPLHQNYHNSLSEYQKQSFEDLLVGLEKQNVSIYDFNTRYVNLEIWEDLSHIVVDQNVSVFNEDVAEIIIQELKK